MISTCSQSAPCSMVRAHSAPSCAKSADRIDGAMSVLGAMFVVILRQYGRTMLKKLSLYQGPRDSSSAGSSNCPKYGLLYAAIGVSHSPTSGIIFSRLWQGRVAPYELHDILTLHGII